MVCVVTDNAANCVADIRLLGWRHLPCFAHTLNLTVQESIKSDNVVVQLQRKCRDIVSYFHRSVEATQKLKEIQKQIGLDEKKRVADVETRWNSSFYMFQRIVDKICNLEKNFCRLILLFRVDGHIF